nr:CAZy families GH18 protein [uncultured bacterium]
MLTVLVSQTDINEGARILRFILQFTLTPRQLSPHIDFVTLQTFDFRTPERNPKELDYPAPLYEALNRKFDENADFQVRYW